MVFEFGETHHRSSDGTSPNEDEETPSPIALVSQCYQGNRGVRTCNMPVDGGMVPLAQSLLPFAPGGEGMVGGGGDI